MAWTPALDARLLTLRAMGATWDSIASEMGLGRYTVLERGRRIGARRPQPPPPPVIDARDRPARPPGHPETWSLINAGTVLEGAVYPYPVFL
jgi:hypothetical protein